MNLIATNGDGDSMLVRLFWILILISSLLVSCYLTILFWSRYTSNPTRTLLLTQTAPTITIPFPGVTICNLNRIIDHKLDTFLSKLDATQEEHKITREVISQIHVSETVRGSVKQVYDDRKLQISESVLTRNDYSEIRRIITRVSQSCEEMFIKCAWNFEVVNCKDIIEESYNVHGRCCSFNFIGRKGEKTPIRTNYYGTNSGLRVIFRPEYNRRSLAGASVILHNPDDFPNGDFNLMKTLPIGRAVYMQVDASRRECSEGVRSLNVEYRGCIYPDERHLEFFTGYTYSNCLSLCEASIVLDKCQCVPYFYDFIDRSDGCSECPDESIEQPGCDLIKMSCWAQLNGMENHLCSLSSMLCSNNVTHDIHEKCECPSQCEENYYECSMTSAKLTNNSDMWLDSFLKGFNDTQNSILLEVSFLSAGQSVWLRDTITSITYLAASFGGIYSLFLGCSVITLFEIIYFFIVKTIRDVLFKNNVIADQGPPVPIKISIIGNVEPGRMSERSMPMVPFIN